MNTDLTRFALLALSLGAVACAPTAGSHDDADDGAPPALGDDDDDTNVGDDDDTKPGDDDDSTEVPDGVCPDDVYEDNDDQNGAVQLGAGLYAGLTSCTDDEDWYAIQVPVGEQLSVALTFLDDEGDIDVTVTDAGGAFLAGSSSTTDDELAGPVEGTGDWMFVKVRLFADEGSVAGNDYDLDLSVGAAPPPEVCPTDSFEENDAFAAAVPLTAATASTLTVCSADQDWYSIAVGAGQTLTVSALFPHAEGDVDITLYDATETWLASSVSVTDDEELSWTATDAATVTLKVALYNDNGTAVGNDYDLGISLQ